MTDIPKPLREFLEKSGYVEQSPKDWFILKVNDTEIAVDLRGDAPKVGVQIGGVIQEEGHGILRVQDIRNKVEYLWSKGAGNGKNVKKEAKSDPAPQPNQWKCDKCGTMNGEILDFCKDCGTAKGYAPPEKSLAEEVKPDTERARVAKKGSKETEVVNNSTGANLGTSGTYGLPDSKAPPVPARVHRPDALVPVHTFSPQGSMIKGMQPALKEIGKIKIGRKGEKKTGSGYRLPEKFDHFEITTVLRDGNGNLLPDPIMKMLCESPKELSVMLLYNDPTLNFVTRYNEYKGGKCMCQGDGIEARTLEGEKIECNPETCQKFQQKKCKPNGILSVILTESPRLGGVYKFRTTSYNSIRSILSSLFFISSLTGGVLAMIPLKLTVTPQTVQPKDSQTAQTIYVVNIEFPGTAQQLLEKTVEVSKYQMGMRIQIQQLESQARLALTEPETEAEIKDVVDEFYPEQAQAQEVSK